MTRRAILLYDLNECERACIATRNAITVLPCPHGATWQCGKVTERYVFDTTSPAEAELMGNALPDARPAQNQTPHERKST